MICLWSLTAFNIYLVTAPTSILIWALITKHDDESKKERLSLPPQSSFSWPTSQSSIFLSFFICLWFSRSYQVLGDNTSKSKLFKRGFTGARRRRIVNEQSYVVAIILESRSRCMNLIMFHCLIRISVSYSYSSLSSWLSTSWNPWYSYLSP